MPREKGMKRTSMGEKRSNETKSGMDVDARVDRWSQEKDEEEMRGKTHTSEKRKDLPRETMHDGRWDETLANPTPCNPRPNQETRSMHATKIRRDRDMTRRSTNHARECGRKHADSKLTVERDT